MAKQLLASMQSEVLDEHGTDCKCKKTIKIKITKQNKNDFRYRYIMEGNKPVGLTDDTIEKYIDKEVNLRSPMYCTGEKICNICAGEMNYKLDSINIGLGTSKIANTLTNLGMKAFHTANLKSTQINVDEILI